MPPGQDMATEKCDSSPEEKENEDESVLIRTPKPSRIPIPGWIPFPKKSMRKHIPLTGNTGQDLTLNSSSAKRLASPSKPFLVEKPAANTTVQQPPVTTIAAPQPQAWKGSPKRDDGHDLRRGPSKITQSVAESTIPRLASRVGTASTDALGITMVSTDIPWRPSSQASVSKDLLAGRPSLPRLSTIQSQSEESKSAHSQSPASPTQHVAPAAPKVGKLPFEDSPRKRQGCMAIVPLEDEPTIPAELLDFGRRQSLVKNEDLQVVPPSTVTDESPVLPEIILQQHKTTSAAEIDHDATIAPEEFGKGANEGLQTSEEATRAATTDLPSYEYQGKTANWFLDIPIDRCIHPVGLIETDREYIRSRLQEMGIEDSIASSSGHSADPAAVEDARHRLEGRGVSPAPPPGEPSPFAALKGGPSKTASISDPFGERNNANKPTAIDKRAKGTAHRQGRMAPPAGIARDSVDTLDSLKHLRRVAGTVRRRPPYPFETREFSAWTEKVEKRSQKDGDNRASSRSTRSKCTTDTDPDVQHHGFSRDSTTGEEQVLLNGNCPGSLRGRPISGISRSSAASSPKPPSSAFKPEEPRQEAPISRQEARKKEPLKQEDAKKKPDLHSDHRQATKDEEKPGEQQPSEQEEKPYSTLSDFQRGRLPAHIGPGFMASGMVSERQRRERDEFFREKARKDRMRAVKSHSHLRPSSTERKPRLESKETDKGAEPSTSGFQDLTATGHRKLSKAWNSLKRGTGKLLTRKSLANLRGQKEDPPQTKPEPMPEPPKTEGRTRRWAPPTPTPPTSGADQVGMTERVPRPDFQVAPWLYQVQDLDPADRLMIEERFSVRPPASPAQHATAKRNKSTPNIRKDSQDAAQALLPSFPLPSPPPGTPLPSPPRPGRQDESSVDKGSPSEQARKRRDAKQELNETLEHKG